MSQKLLYASLLYFVIEFPGFLLLEYPDDYLLHDSLGRFITFSQTGFAAFLLYYANTEGRSSALQTVLSWIAYIYCGIVQLLFIGALEMGILSVVITPGVDWLPIVEYYVYWTFGCLSSGYFMCYAYQQDKAEHLKAHTQDEESTPAVPIKRDDEIVLLI